MYNIKKINSIPDYRSKQMENKNFKIIPCTTVSENMKYLGLNLIKSLQNIYTKNHKTQLREMKVNLKNWTRFMIWKFQHY